MTAGLLRAATSAEPLATESMEIDVDQREELARGSGEEKVDELDSDSISTRTRQHDCP